MGWRAAASSVIRFGGPGLIMVIAGCAGPTLAPVVAVPAGASLELREAQDLVRLSRRVPPEERRDLEARARSSALGALALAPDWVAPQRLLDDLDRQNLLGPEVLAARMNQQILAGDRPSYLYLTGRLLGPLGSPLLERAYAADSASGWSLHGAAWAQYQAHSSGRAVRLGRKALSRAADPFERAHFTHSLSLYLVGAGKRTEAIELLAGALEEELSPVDWDWLAFERAIMELGSAETWEQERGLARSRELLEVGGASASQVMAILQAAEALGHGVRRQLLVALERSADRWLRDLIVPFPGDGHTPLAAALELEGLPVHHPVRVRALLAAGRPADALNGWLEGVPVFLLDEDGLPQDPTLTHVVRTARVAQSDSGRERGVLAFGEALIDAGWYEEALAYASSLPAGDVSMARSLEARARTGISAFEDLRSLFDSLDRGTARREPDLGLGAEPGEAAQVSSVEDLLGALAPLLARAHWAQDPHDLGRNERADQVLHMEQELRSSPRLDYGFLGQVVHPGPRFSVRDEARGLGLAGEPVPGLAAQLGEHRRFGVIGKGLGQELDGTVLRILQVERKSGEHLGVPWSGTVAWCEGADLETVVGRQRLASIAGAALHEGYWIDLAQVRGARTRWVQLRDRYGADLAQIERILAVTGPLLDTWESAGLEDVGRADVVALLGEADRVRLRVMADLARSAGDGTLLVAPGLDEFAHMAAVHEEGHLTDHARFLPLFSRLPAVLSLLLRVGFSPTELAEELELRAELIALCDGQDPRLSLVALLSAAESGALSATPHAGGYRRLLDQLLELLDRQLEQDPARWPELDPDRQLVHQLHRLGPDKVRALALDLARERGMVEQRPVD